VSLLMWTLTRVAWPGHLESSVEDSRPDVPR
jgi:hypothetical protein